MTPPPCPARDRSNHSPDHSQRESCSDVAARSPVLRPVCERPFLAERNSRLITLGGGDSLDPRIRGISSPPRTARLSPFRGHTISVPDRRSASALTRGRETLSLSTLLGGNRRGRKDLTPQGSLGKMWPTGRPYKSSILTAAVSQAPRPRPFLGTAAGPSFPQGPLPHSRFEVLPQHLLVNRDQRSRSSLNDPGRRPR